MDIARRRRNDVEVVEQPFGRGWHHPVLLGVVGKRGIDLPQRSHVLFELTQVGAASPAGSWFDREQGGQTAGVLLEQLDAE
jgi:hypothetical protein